MTDPSSQTPYWGAETENQDVTLYTWGVDNRYYPSATASKTIGSFHTGAVYISTSDIQLEKVTYSVSMSAEAAISPSDYCKTATYSESSGKYTMKSGYGIQISVDAHLSGDTQYCTGSQTANVMFPEFNYNRHSTTLYNRLLEKSGGSFFSGRINIRPTMTGFISRRFGFRTGKTTPYMSRFSTCGVRLVSFR